MGDKKDRGLNLLCQKSVLSADDDGRQVVLEFKEEPRHISRGDRVWESLYKKDDDSSEGSSEGIDENIKPRFPPSLQTPSGEV